MSIAPAKPNPWFELIITILVPALVLMQLSSASRLGPAGALVLVVEDAPPVEGEGQGGDDRAFAQAGVQRRGDGWRD